LEVAVDVSEPPAEVKIRKAVEALGTGPHRFVRCKLKDGRELVGGIDSMDQDRFWLTQGIQSREAVGYGSLETAPEPDPAPLEHFLNGLKWTGLVAASVAAAPLALRMAASCGFELCS
jgi:hypothetical protein